VIKNSTIDLLADTCCQPFCKPIIVSCKSQAEPLQRTMRLSEIFELLARAR